MTDVCRCHALCTRRDVCIWADIMLSVVRLLMHLECPTYTAIGAAFAGAPFVVIGHSSRIAWGMTNTGADVQDLYVLSPSTMGEDYYMLDGEHRAFELDEQVIKVSGGDDVPLTVRRSWWGPVVTDVLRDDHHSDYRGTDLLALNWTGIDEQIEDTTVETYHQLGSVTSWAEFRAATARFVGPSQNFVYASNENEYGQIGYVLAGWGTYPTVSWWCRGFVCHVCHVCRLRVSVRLAYDYDLSQSPGPRSPAIVCSRVLTGWSSPDTLLRQPEHMSHGPVSCARQ